jgi:hypothetical protein
MTTTKQTLKAGTRIEFPGLPAFPGFPGVAPHTATISRWTAVNGAVKNHVSPTNGGWHVVRFEDGGQLLAHESGFRVIDNRGA